MSYEPSNRLGTEDEYVYDFEEYENQEADFQYAKQELVKLAGKILASGRKLPEGFWDR